MSDQEQILNILRSMQERMVTKDDLVGFATKKDLEGFATKKDLQESIGALRIEIQQDSKKFATKDDLRETASEILSAVDGIAKNHEKFDAELAAGRSKANRLEERLEVVELKIASQAT